MTPMNLVRWRLRQLYDFASSCHCSHLPDVKELINEFENYVRDRRFRESDDGRMLEYIAKKLRQFA